jgi:hypothetical protein
MTTKLEKPLKREILIGKDPYVVTLTPLGVKLTPKGKRKGYELAWASLVSGDAELALALRAATARGPEPTETEKHPAPRRSKKR